MRLPIRNHSRESLTVLIEPMCYEHPLAVGEEAIVRLEDGLPHSIDISEGWVTIWDEGCNATVEVVSKSDKSVDDALDLAATWLYRLGAERESWLIRAAIDELECVSGYFSARARVFAAFYDGFLRIDGERFTEPRPEWRGETLEACYQAGLTAAELNRSARQDRSHAELGAAPFDTDTVQSEFSNAAAAIGYLG